MGVTNHLLTGMILQVVKHGAINGIKTNGFTGLISPQEMELFHPTFFSGILGPILLPFPRGEGLPWGVFFSNLFGTPVQGEDLPAPRAFSHPRRMVYHSQDMS